MAETASKPAPVTPLTVVRKTPPVTVREARVGSIFLRLKRWEDGEHSIELSQKTRFTGPDGKAVYHQVSFGEFEATGIADAIASLTSVARHAK